MRKPYQLIFEKLFQAYGPQHWWPADTLFEMIIGAILVQNTSWKNVEKAFPLLRPFLHPEKLERLPTEQLGQLIRPSGFYNIKAKRIKSFLKWFKTYHYDFERLKNLDLERLRTELLSINGIGKETADCILLYGFNFPVFVVDAYTRRTFYRIGYDMPDSYDTFRMEVEKELPRDPELFNEFHALLVEHGKKHCTAAPVCENCPLHFCCEQRLESSANNSK